MQSFGNFHFANLIANPNQKNILFELEGRDIIARSLNLNNVMMNEVIKIQLENNRDIEQEIRFVMMGFMANPEIIESLKNKAKTNNIPFKMQLYRDAKWVIEEEIIEYHKANL